MSDYEPLSGYNIPDRQQEAPLCYCHECGGALYRGDTVYRVSFTDIYYCENCINEEELDDECDF